MMKLPFEMHIERKREPEYLEKLEYLKKQVPELMDELPTEEEALQEAIYVSSSLIYLEERYDVLKELPYPEVRLRMGTWLSIDDANISERTRAKLQSRGFDAFEDVIDCATHCGMDELKKLGLAHKYIFKDLNKVCEELGYAYRFEL